MRTKFLWFTPLPEHMDCNRYLCVLRISFLIIVLISGCYQASAVSVDHSALAASLRLSFGNEHQIFSYEDLLDIETYQGVGGRLKITGDVTGPFSYTGVRMSLLKNQISGVPSTYGIVTISSDGFIQYFSHDQVIGQVMVYDTDGQEIGEGGVTMMLAYQEEGISDFSGGPYRVSWVNQDQPVTDAFLWSKYVKEVEFIDDSSGDDAQPTLSFHHPVNGLYIRNRRLFPFPIPFILGDITIQIDAADSSGISQVVVLIDNELKAQLRDEPFEWTWDETALGRHTISLATYDLAGNIALQEQEVWILNP